MDLMKTLKVALKVMCDWRVIFITVFSVLFLCLVGYVVKYKKKPKPKVVVKAAPAAPAAPAAEENAEEQKTEEPAK